MQTLRYTDGYRPAAGTRPGSLTLTLLVGGAIVSAMFFVSPHFARDPETHIKGINIPLDPPPPPDPRPKPKQPPKLERRSDIVVPPVQPVVKTDPAPMVKFTPTPPLSGDLAGEGTVPAKIEPAKPPMLTGAELDQRYAANFQPVYPADAIRDGREGHVTVRVLIGTDGRVREVEKLAAPSDSFFEATRKRALEKWRFRPATRDGVPYETWKTVGVTFVLNES
ncbi:MAG: energy transducer TonB [Sphingomonas sp.]